MKDITKWLEAEIKKREDILSDDFLRANLEGIELGTYAIELEVYQRVLAKLK